MDKTPLMSAGIAAVVAAAVLIGSNALGSQKAAPRPDRGEEIAALHAAVKRVEGELDASRNQVRSVRQQLGQLREELEQRDARIAEVAVRPPEASGDAGGARERKRSKAALDGLKALQKKVFAGTATEQEQRKFWGLARSGGLVDELMDDLEEAVEAGPSDLDARMNLAQAYIAKLLSIPGGPEQGIWGAKAESQWRAVLEIDPDHWDARYSIAFGYSQYPEFLNKTPDAIAEFEILRETQERRGVEPRHAQTYLQLSILYRRQGNNEKAAESLRAGVERHPDDEGLQKALTSMGKEW